MHFIALDRHIILHQKPPGQGQPLGCLHARFHIEQAQPLHAARRAFQPGTVINETPSIW